MVGYMDRRKIKWSRGALEVKKMGVRGSPIGRSDVDVHTSVKGWWCELWGRMGWHVDPLPRLLGCLGVQR